MLPGARISDVKGGRARRLTEAALVRAMKDAAQSIRGHA
jgi:hypothetical protein